MNPQDKNNPPVTLYLQTLVGDLLGEAHYVPVSHETATMIWHACKNNHTVHVQFPTDLDNVDILGLPLVHPLLWQLAAWRNSSERHMKAKLRAKREKEALDIFRANVRIVARAILRTAYINPDAAHMIAHQWLKRDDKVRIAGVGVTKLISRVEEL